MKRKLERASAIPSLYRREWKVDGSFDQKPQIFDAGSTDWLSDDDLAYRHRNEIVMDLNSGEQFRLKFCNEYRDAIRNIRQINKASIWAAKKAKEGAYRDALQSFHDWLSGIETEIADEISENEETAMMKCSSSSSVMLKGIPDEIIQQL